LLTISQKRFFVSLDELALSMEPDIKLSMIAWASTEHGRHNGHLPPAWKLGLKPNISGKTWSRYLNSD